MKKKLAVVLALVTLLTMTSLALADISNDQATLNQIAVYRQWTRINPEPVKVMTAAIDSASVFAGG
jgi:hypothetical protein